MSSAVVPSEVIESKIFLIRGYKIMLDRHLAVLYGVMPFRLREQVKRNIDRFPSDFMFQLSKEEADFMVSQNAIPALSYLGGYLPYAFTQEGVAMLSSVLRSKRAIEVNISIMRAFVKLRELMMTHKDLARKIEDLERKFHAKFEDHDKKIILIFEAIKQLLKEKEKISQNKGPIGFVVPKVEGSGGKFKRR